MQATITGEELLEAALTYASMGMKVIPLREHGKIPILDQWPEQATSDPNTIRKWWQNGNRNYNIGIKLGTESGIIDIECDSKEAEQDLLKLFDDDVPIAPTYLAARGKHRLFATSGGLPLVNIVKFNNLEIRLGMIGGIQSVFPPSVHESGIQYTWVEGLSINDCKPPVLPTQVLDKLKQLTRRQSTVTAGALTELLQGVPEGMRSNSAASVAGYVLAHLTELNSKTRELLDFIMQAWNAHNSPPLPNKELLSTINSIWLREVNHRAQYGPPWLQRSPPPESNGRKPEEPHKPAKLEDGFIEGPNETIWRIHAINYDGNHKFLIESNLFGDTKIEVTARQILSSKLTAVAILEQTATCPPSWFDEWWPQVIRDAIQTCKPQTAEHDHTTIGTTSSIIIDYVHRMRMQRKEPGCDEVLVFPALISRFAKEHGVAVTPEQIGKILSKVGADRKGVKAKILGETAATKYARVITQEVLERLSELT